MQFLYRMGAISLVKVNDALASPLTVFDPTRAMAKQHAEASKIRPGFFIGDSTDVDVTTLFGLEKLLSMGLVPLDREILLVHHCQVNGWSDRDGGPGAPRQ